MGASTRHLLALFWFIAVLVTLAQSASTPFKHVHVSTVEAVYDAYPVGPPSSFTAKVVELEAREDIYIRPSMCKPIEKSICTESNFFPCCKNPEIDCDPITLKSKNSSCACASRSDRICVDPWTPYQCALSRYRHALTRSDLGDKYLSSPPWFDLFTFEIPLQRNCHHIVISTGSLIGDYDLYLNYWTPSIEEDGMATVLGAFSFGQESLLLCANDTYDVNISNALYAGVNDIETWMSNKPPGDEVARITGVLFGYGHFNLSVSGARFTSSAARAMRSHGPP